MTKKIAVIFEYEYNLERNAVLRGNIARLDAGHGEVALFDTIQQAEEWVEKGEDIDSSCFNIGYIEVDSK